MTDRRPPEDHPFADFFAEPEQPATRREARVHSPRRSTRRGGGRGPRRWIAPLITTVVVLGLLAGAGVFLYSTFGSQVQSMFAAKETDDYTGSGTGEVMFVINSGDDGSLIAENLQAAGVVKSSETFYDLLLKQATDPVFQPGTYKLASEMSSQSALTALQDPANKVDYTATIPEGTTAANVLQILADATGMPLSDFQAAAANYTQFGVPAQAPSIEGYLFPATYTFEPGQTPTDMLKAMVDRTFQSLDQAGVAPDDRYRVLTLAALIQKEAGSNDDMYKVSRVFLNRIDDGMNLQSDATVAYGAGHTNVETTQAERDDASNPYNTYANPGLPVGPISNPGDVAIDAALHPADGPWLYFVTVNLDTGETVFSTTAAEHDAAVAQLQQWWAEHPEYQ